MLKGVGVSEGFGIGPALKIIREDIAVPTDLTEEPDVEIERFIRALEEIKGVTEGLLKEASEKTGGDESGIFEAHLAILEDEDSLIDPIKEKILIERKNSALAVEEQFEHAAAVFDQISDEYFAARAADIRSLKNQLIRNILNICDTDISALQDDVILIARDLAPSDTIKLDTTHVSGIVCEEGGKTGHTAIIARAMGIPTIVGCKGIISEVNSGDNIIIDGSTGVVHINPDKSICDDYAARLEADREDKAALEAYRGMHSVTLDGRIVSICANIATPEECKSAVEADCEGVGLFRSEFLYMDRTEMPGEEEQFEFYRQALEVAGERPVTIRTLDAGGDKSLPGLIIPDEQNPFLGYRAIRICLDNIDIFKTQLRALYRASIYGNLRIMFPMISSLSELRRAKELADEVRCDLENENIPFDKDVMIGIMVEVPSVAVMADIFAKEVDFFSIGTNDLIQYTVAVDRGNDKIKGLYSHYHPAVIRLIANTIKEAHKNNIHCCMCGEAASDLAYIPLLIGLGLDEFSMSAPNILNARRVTNNSSLEECMELADRVRKALTSQEVKDILDAKDD